MNLDPASDGSLSASRLLTLFRRVLDKHALAAQRSQYDRRVAVTAIAKARAAIDAVPVTGGAAAYGRRVVRELGALQETYNDTDGEYTNGRGLLGSLLADLTVVAEKAAE